MNRFMCWSTDSENKVDSRINQINNDNDDDDDDDNNNNKKKKKNSNSNQRNGRLPKRLLYENGKGT